VGRVRGENGVVATVPLSKGDEVLRVDGALVDRPSRTSVQVGEGEHVDVPPGVDDARVRVEFPWRYLNHSCDANARLVGRSLVALRAIAAGEEVTFDYRTTEWDMATPFTCRCGAPSCTGERIAGFSNLSPATQERLRPFATDVILACLARAERERAPAGVRRNGTRRG
jgi:hypothetical protein